MSCWQGGLFLQRSKKFIFKRVPKCFLPTWNWMHWGFYKLSFDICCQLKWMIFFSLKYTKKHGRDDSPAHPLIAGRDHMLWRRRWNSQNTYKCWKDRWKVLEFFRNWPQIPPPLIIFHTHTQTRPDRPPPAATGCRLRYNFCIWQVDTPRNPSYCSRSCGSCQQPLQQEVWIIDIIINTQLTRVSAGVPT